MKVSKAWLQTYFDDPLPSTENLVELITFGIFEVEEVQHKGDDDILDIKVLPDRSSYALSHRGIAREIATLIDRQLKEDPFRTSLPLWTASEKLRVSIADPVYCSRYMGAVMTDVTVKESPAWLKGSLEAIGQKSINNIVDATNYVMFNLGQPLHAFDANTLTSNDGMYAINVRSAKKDETIKVLSGEVYTLSHNDLVITDGNTDTPIAIAGIKGGKAAEITANTRTIILEAANFNYVSIRKTSRTLRLATDASLRFQNQPSPELVAYAMRDVIALISDIAGGKLEGIADVYERKPLPHKPIRVTLDDMNGILGTTITTDSIDHLLARLGFECALIDGVYEILPSWERRDLILPEDIAEEIGRVYGYNTIKAVVPEKPKEAPAINKCFYYEEKVRAILIGRGFSEVYTYTLTPQGDIEILNPLASDKAFLRSSLRDGIKESLDLNAYHAPLLGLDTIRIFEIGSVFSAKHESVSCVLAVRAVKGKQSNADALLSEAIEALKTEGFVINGDVKDGSIEFSFDDAIAALPIPKAYDAPRGDSGAIYKPISSYPFVLRDIALWVPDNIVAPDVVSVLYSEGGDLLARTDLFDEFKKDGRTSYAFHLVFQSNKKTLNDEEIHPIMERVSTAMREKGWEVR